MNNSWWWVFSQNQKSEHWISGVNLCRKLSIFSWHCGFYLLSWYCLLNQIISSSCHNLLFGDQEEGGTQPYLEKCVNYNEVQYRSETLWGQYRVTHSNTKVTEKHVIWAIAETSPAPLKWFIQSFKPIFLMGTNF